jgi:PAS domain S-box-containing protein
MDSPAAATYDQKGPVSLVSFLQRRLHARPEGRDAHVSGPPKALELQALTSMSAALGRSEDPEAVARVLIDEVRAHFYAEVAAVALLSDDGNEATGLLAHGNEGELAWWREVTIDLRTEPSGIASAAFEAVPFAVYDAEHSPALHPELVARIGVKSAAFIPLISEGRVSAVLAVATTTAPRAFARDELAMLQALAGEAALALGRTRSSSALAEALQRERLVAAIARRVRSELDLDAVLRVAVEETGRALEVARCFIRLGEPGGSMPIAAEWDADGLESIGSVADRLPASNLAARERRTVVIADVARSPELEDPTLGGRATLLDLGTEAVLATPILVFDRMIGVFALHRSESGSWTSGEIALAEAVAREAGLAIHTAQLLRENSRRLEQQVALLQAARVVTAELRLEAVLQRLVDEVAPLLNADAADCYLIDPDRGTFQCAAVHGLPLSLIGLEFPVGSGLAAQAVKRGHPVVSSAYGTLTRPVPHSAYEDFQGVIVAPVTWSGETRGVLGVGTKDPVRAFSDADAMLLEAFASLASLALRNAESFEERSRQARIESGFYRIAAVLGETLSIAETVEAVAHAACDALGGDSACVLTPGAQGLRPAGTWGLPEDLQAKLAEGLLPDTPVLEGVARDRRLLAAPSLVGDERFGAGWEELGYASLLAVPLSVPRTDESGLVVVLFRQQRELVDDDLDLAVHLAQAARGALERAELFETERNSRTLSQQLAQSGSVVASELDPAAVLDETVQRAPAMLGVEACVFVTLEGEELVVASASGYEAESAIGLRFPATAKPAGDVLAAGSPLGLDDVGSDESAARGDPLLGSGFSAYLGVPLTAPDGEGVLAVYSRAPRVWRQEETDALAALAAGAASALANAELYQRVTHEKERSEAILANIADGIVAVDRDGQVVLWNAAAQGITGVAASEALGRRPVDVLQRRLEAEGDVTGGDRLVSIPRGSEDVWLSLTEAVMRDPAGAVSGRIFAFRDISGERAVEQMKSDFVSAVSHELRTPLTSIYGFAETLLRADLAFGDQERATFLGYIASEAERLTRIVDTLLNVARLDSGDLTVTLAPIDVRSLITEVVAEVEESAVASGNGHRFVIDLPEGPFDAHTDRDKLRQVLSQLVDNAVKYSPEGATVTITGRQTEVAFEFLVSDEGVGIPHAEQDRIFRKFYRGEASTREGRLGGTGLGLFIAQGLVSALGGRISVTSTEGAGACFAFAIPLVETSVAGTV